jgi:hypothetical protein
MISSLFFSQVYNSRNWRMQPSSEYFSVQSAQDHSLAVVARKMRVDSKASYRAGRASKPKWRFGAPEAMKMISAPDNVYKGGADEVETALEQLSPTASLIRNARLNE